MLPAVEVVLTMCVCHNVFYGFSMRHCLPIDLWYTCQLVCLCRLQVLFLYRTIAVLQGRARTIPPAYCMNFVVIPV